MHLCLTFSFFFFNATATPEIYTLSLHDALPIWFRNIGGTSAGAIAAAGAAAAEYRRATDAASPQYGDRKSTRLNSSHVAISYAVFCLKKKKKHTQTMI